MGNGELALDEEKWTAITMDDPAYDGRFWYAVKTTGIFCRPSCKSRPPKRDNIRVFSAAQHALGAGFRPCKRCRPTGEELPDAAWTAAICQFIDSHYAESLTLELLAEKCHGSPYHLHRTFKKGTGITPVEYLQQVRVAKACEYLLNSRLMVSEISRKVGFRSTPYFIALFRKKTGFTPAEFREREADKPVYATRTALEFAVDIEP